MEKKKFDLNVLYELLTQMHIYRTFLRRADLSWTCLCAVFWWLLVTDNTASLGRCVTNHLSCKKRYKDIGEVGNHRYSHYLGIEFYLFISHEGMNDRGSMCKFLMCEALFKIYTWILCLSSYWLLLWYYNNNAVFRCVKKENNLWNENIITWLSLIRMQV